jgi:serine protease Do
MLPVKLAERPAREDELQAQPAAPAASEAPVPLGLSVREMDRAFITRFEIPEDVRGVVVMRVDPTGPAHQTLRRGIVILEINRRPTRSLLEYQQIVGRLRAGEVLAIYYYDPTLAQRGLVTLTVD